MSESINITIDGEALEYLRKASNPEAVLRALMRTLDQQNQQTVAYVVNKIISLPRQGPTSPTGLRTKTGRLRGSLRQSYPTLKDNGLVSAIGSHVVYAGILEEGGTTKPHVIQARNAKALHFNGMFRRSVNHPGSRIPGRHYVRRGIQARLNEYSSAMSDAIFHL